MRTSSSLILARIRTCQSGADASRCIPWPWTDRARALSSVRTALAASLISFQCLGISALSSTYPRFPFPALPFTTRSPIPSLARLSCRSPTHPSSTMMSLVGTLPSSRPITSKLGPPISDALFLGFFKMWLISSHQFCAFRTMPFLWTLSFAESLACC